MSHEPLDDTLEAELRSLRPRELPGRLVGRIEASLADESENAPGRPTMWLRVAAAAVGVAACVAIAALFWRGGRGKAPADDTPVAVRPDTTALPAVPSSRPGGVRLAEYRAALARSSEAVDALLEQDEPRPPKPGRRSASFRAFQGSALDLEVPGQP